MKGERVEDSFDNIEEKRIEVSFDNIDDDAESGLQDDKSWKKLLGIDGSKVQKVLESVHIAANKNTVLGDVSAMVPGGIRMGLVVEETAFIGNNVSILHNVTLGGTGKARGDRHLKIGDGEVPPRTTAVGNPARVVGGKDNPIKLDKMPIAAATICVLLLGSQQRKQTKAGSQHSVPDLC
ncbi:uncharacterized protein [Glycine max]|uniref:uncharacterized protein n=1 Tax=Glycine max TaxID=3847 RepID=UPI001B3555FB|nr:uncharacterized protein LOC121173961 [Glycine max]